MTTFDDKEKAFETKYARDQEKKFKILVRRNRLLGLWAAEQMGMEPDEAEAYAKQVVAADFDEPGEEDVFRKVHQDLQARNLEISERRVRRQMSELLGVAMQQIEQG